MPFTKGRSGNPAGKPYGAKDRYPRSAKRAIEHLLEHFGSDTALLKRVLQRGLEARPPTSFPYFRLLVEQQLGAPDQAIILKNKVILAPRD